MYVIIPPSGLLLDDRRHLGVIAQGTLHPHPTPSHPIPTYFELLLLLPTLLLLTHPIGIATHPSPLSS